MQVMFVSTQNTITGFRVTSEYNKPQKHVTYRDKKIQVMQHELMGANFILQKNLDTNTLEKEILIPLLLRNWV